MEPVVRHMLLCEEVRKRSDNPFKFDLLGVFSIVRPINEFPVRLSFSVFLETTGRGTGYGNVCLVEADSDEVVYRGTKHTMLFGPDPLQIRAVAIRIVSCTLERPGLYWVDFMYNGQQVQREPLLVKEFP
jgi:uncharacterized protein DUF6941